MPAPALDQIQLLTPNAVTQTPFGKYTGNWIVHLPAITSPPGDGSIKEVDFTVPHPTMTGVVVGFYVSSSDGLASHWSTDQVLDTTALPAWCSVDTFIASVYDWNEPTTLSMWDGGFTNYDLSTSIIVDAANSDPAWYGWAGPHISSFTPTTGSPRDTYVLTGAGFTGATDVAIAGGAPDSFTVDSDTQITAVVGVPKSAGIVGVHFTVAGLTYWSFQDYTVVSPPPPTISTITPNHAPHGDTVVVTGSGFTGADAVLFQGFYSASFTVISGTEVHFVVPSVTPQSGTIVVQNDGGNSPSQSFTVDPPPVPVITSISPARPFPGDTVAVVGSHFATVTDVEVRWSSVDHPATFTVVDDSHLTFVVPAAAPPDNTVLLAITDPDGTGTFPVPIHGPAPAITSISPERGTPDSQLVTGEPVLTIDVVGTHLYPGGTVTAAVGGLSVPVTIIDATHLRIGPVPVSAAGWYDETPSAGEQVLSVAVTTIDGTAVAPQPFHLFPKLYAALESTFDPGAIFSAQGGRFVRLDATHVLVYGKSLGSPYGADDHWGAAVIDHTDPAALVVGSRVALFVDAETAGYLINSSSDQVRLAASPDGTIIFAGCLYYNAGDGTIAGSIAQIVSRSGMTLTASPTSIYPDASTAMPQVYASDPPANPCVLSNTRLLAPYREGSPEASLWAISPAGMGSPLWYGGPVMYDLMRIDGSHVFYRNSSGLTVGIAAISDSGSVLGGTVNTDLSSDGVLTRLRQETSRPGWFRGYHRVDASTMWEMEYHLDPAAMTATGGVATEFGGSATLDAPGFQPDSSGPFSEESMSITPVIDHDIYDPGLNGTSQIVLGVEGPGTGSSGGERVIEYGRLYVHKGFSIPAVSASASDGFYYLGGSRVIGIEGIRSTFNSYHSSPMPVWRLAIANPPVASPLRWGWPLG